MSDLMEIDYQASDEAGETLPAYKPDEDQVAQEIAARWDGKVMYLHGEWFVWDEGCWRKRAGQQFKQRIRELLRDYRFRGLAVKNSLINSIAELLALDMFMSDEEYNAVTPDHERYIPLMNGLFDVDAMRLMPHDPNLLITVQLGFNYDPNATCPMFERYLSTSLVRPDSEEPDPEVRALMQEALGYSMTSRTDLKSSFWLVGKPDSGKSTMIAFLRGLMGSLHGTIDLNQLGGNKFMLANIVGKRVVTFTEAEDNVMLPAGLYKALVGGSDEIFADVKNRPGITFKPQAKLWWGMNAAPRTADRSGATLNRLKIIPFNHSIPKERRISNLERMLLAESPGIFNWALDGLIRLAERGRFTEPEQSQAWLEQYRYANDTELLFLEEMCIRDTTARIQAEPLYESYRSWCSKFGYQPKNYGQIPKEWLRLGLVKRAINGRYYYQGVKFKEVTVRVDLSNL